MRRALLGGLGIALGMLARPAIAQQGPGQPAAAYRSPTATPSNTSNRAAGLGRPIAVPDAEPRDPAITPAGLVARGQSPPAGAPTTLPAPMPVGAQGQGQGPGVPPSATPLSTPRPIGGGGPTTSEIRDPSGRIIPGAGYPVGAQPNAVVVPSVLPGDAGLRGFPLVRPDDALYNCPPGYGCPSGVDAITRISGCGTGHWWVSGEYLLWWTRSTQLPVLATTGIGTLVNTGTGTQVIPPPGVPLLAGSFGQTLHGGARFSGGYWFDENQIRGVDARLMFLFRNGSSFETNSNAFPVLARPFFNANTPVGPSADIIGFPGVAAGGLSVKLENSLWGAEVNYRRNLLGGICAPCFRLDALAGYRYLNFKEQLDITETGFLVPGSPLLGTGLAPIATATDRFRAENNFHGGQIGLVGELRRGRWYIDGRASIAFGTVFQTGEINGGQAQVLANGTVTQSAGGLLALPGANIGTFHQSRFAVLPEAGINIGYQVTPRLRMFVGYDFLYLSSVVRPAGMIDPVVDAGRIPNFLTPPPPVLPGAPRPSPQMRTTDFFAQGINFGLSWTW